MNDNKPVFNIRNKNFEIAVFKHTYSSEYGDRDSYSVSIKKSVKNKNTGNWDEYKFSLFEEEMLPVTEMIKMAYYKLISVKNNKKKQAVAAPAPDIAAEIDAFADTVDEIPF